MNRGFQKPVASEKIPEFRCPLQFDLSVPHHLFSGFCSLFIERLHLMSPMRHNNEEIKASRIPVENYVKAFAVGEQLLHSKTRKKIHFIYQRK